ncbi:hypothetical protein KKD49_04005 [Myxococcota bacterium]|nr:hypothetical protein [Myxococcota bacterium]
MYDDNLTQQIKTGLAFLLGKWMKYFSEGQPKASETVRYLIAKNLHAGTMDTVENISEGVGFYVSSEENLALMPDETHFFTSFDYVVAYWTGLGKPSGYSFQIIHNPEYCESIVSELEVLEMLGEKAFCEGGKSEVFKPSLLMADDHIFENLKNEEFPTE